MSRRNAHTPCIRRQVALDVCVRVQNLHCIPLHLCTREGNSQEPLPTQDKPVKARKCKSQCEGSGGGAPESSPSAAILFGVSLYDYAHPRRMCTLPRSCSFISAPLCLCLCPVSRGPLHFGARACNVVSRSVRSLRLRFSEVAVLRRFLSFYSFAFRLCERDPLPAAVTPITYVNGCTCTHAQRSVWRKCTPTPPPPPPPPQQQQGEARKSKRNAKKEKTKGVPCATQRPRRS